MITILVAGGLEKTGGRPQPRTAPGLSVHPSCMRRRMHGRCSGSYLSCIIFNFVVVTLIVVVVVVVVAVAVAVAVAVIKVMFAHSYNKNSHERAKEES